MAPKQSKPARPPGQTQPKPTKSILEILTLPAALLTLAAISSPISQATLSPVFGSIPASINHSEAVAATTLLGFLCRWQFKSVPGDSVLGYLAVWAFWIPVLSAYLFRYSGSLGIVYGPALIGFLSCHTIIIPASYVAAEALEELHLETKVGPVTAPLLLALLGVFHLVSFERFFRTLLPGLQTVTGTFTPVKAQALIASTIAYFAHSKLALLGLPALIHVFSANPHFDSARTLNTLDTTLHQHNWSIVARQWSNTGYISVLDNLESDYRIMRADHSLLGGEWLATDRRRKEEGWRVNEPVYAVFEMLEAVRLVETDTPVPDASAQALVVGLGIGTAPKALLAHGINTTVIELDPAVHEYAIKYFDLPENHTAIIQDAVSAVANLRRQEQKYDYIIHDVFTGGAEPLALFTYSFLVNLSALLKPSGFIAINYAGDPKSPLTYHVLHTISATFGHSCRAYRDTAPTDADTSEGEEEDIMSTFANMVIFCRHSNYLHGVTFREPTKEDFLQRKSAEHYLLPNYAHEVFWPGYPPGERDDIEWDGMLLDSELGWKWKEHQTQSAVRHWHIMRKVVPDVVWELW